jgi:DNA-binding IclR family transcriptional regulator
VDIDEYLREIERTRQRGYAVDLEEYLKGMRAIAALIYFGHFPIAAVWIVGFAASMSDEKFPRIINSLKNTTELISMRLSPFLSPKIKNGRVGS